MSQVSADIFMKIVTDKLAGSTITGTLDSGAEYEIIPGEVRRIGLDEGKPRSRRLRKASPWKRGGILRGEPTLRQGLNHVVRKALENGTEN